MSKTKDFFEIAKKQLEKVKDSQREAIVQAATMMGECMENNGIVQLFGLDHGVAFSMELGYRAGGLMPFHQIKVRDLALRGKISEEELQNPQFNMNPANAQTLFDLYNIWKEDMFIMISADGNQPIIVEAAKMAKEHGHKIIAVVNKAQCAVNPSLHEAGKLTDFADIVIDLMTATPDLAIKLNDEVQMNQLATICGNVIAQMLTAETYRYFVENGKECPVLLSANVKGADVHNRAISDKYLGRWNS